MTNDGLTNDGLSLFLPQVRAKKRITIEEAPNVLTIQLKRFEFGGRGSKISKRVEFGMELDLAPFMSDHPRCGQQMYDLIAVLVHHGHSLHRCVRRARAASGPCSVHVAGYE